MPIEQPSRFDLVVNRTTMDRLGIAIPDEVWEQVTEVVW
jgi:ABC-type uncharacterized transport system substrate-binding protein